MADVILAYVHSATCAVSWTESLWSLQGWDWSHDQRLAGRLRVRCGWQGVPAARNEAARQFLRTDLEWLFWTDTDMGFAADTLDRLLAEADVSEKPVVGALCFAQKMPGDDGLNGYRTEQLATIYDWFSDDEHKGFIARPEYPRDELVRCAGTGSACLLIHRRVFEAIASTQREPWYEPVIHPETGTPIGEDLSFCLRCAIAGIPIHVHTGIRTNHLKQVWLAETEEAPCPTGLSTATP